MKSDISNLKELFFKMNKDGFDTALPLKWSFYFFDIDKLKLENVFSELSNHDYILDSIRKIDNVWKLKITKTEVLDVEKLHRRNEAFNELAIYCDVDLYDGWDVEKE